MCHIQFFSTDFRCGVYMEPHACILVYPGLGSLFVVYTDDSVIFIGSADYIISTAEKEATSLSDCRDNCTVIWRQEFLSDLITSDGRLEIVIALLVFFSNSCVTTVEGQSDNRQHSDAG